MAKQLQEFWTITDFVTRVKTWDYTAVKRDLILADTDTTGSWTLTLPASPSAGDMVTIQDSKQSWTTNNLTVNRNSSNINGAASDYTADGTIPIIHFIYSGDATVGWQTTPSAGGSSSGGVNEIVLYTQDFKLDDTDTGADAGSAFSGIVDSIDFNPDEDGSIWGSFRIPSNWSSDSDINVELNYSLSGSDNSKVIKLNTYYWAIAEGQTPSIGSPDETNVDDITSSASNTGVYYSGSANVISSATLSASDEKIAFRITRNADDAADTYTGTLQLFSVKFSQS